MFQVLGYWPRVSLTVTRWPLRVRQRFNDRHSPKLAARLKDRPGKARDEPGP